MTMTRDIRRCALQVLYQFDAGNESPDSVRASLVEAPGDEETHDRGYEVALAAWEVRSAADEAVAAVSPDWPTHRQPAVDRSLLRLAHYEMLSGVTPPKVAINEAIELAREFSTERSPQFINGVLDKLFRMMRGESIDTESGDADPETDDDSSMRALSPDAVSAASAPTQEHTG